MCFPFIEFDESLKRLIEKNEFSPVEVTQAGSFKDTSNSPMKHIFEIRSNEEEEFILIFHNSITEHSCIVTAGSEFKSTKQYSKNSEEKN